LYTIKHIQDSANNHNFLEISHPKKVSYAKIHLSLGGSLQELILNNHFIIKDLHPLTYNNTYASSILFPFANRVADGLYEFEGKEYSLDINQSEENNALHGLVYNKTFELIDQNAAKEKAFVLLRYEETQYSKGFPYTYTIDLKYTLTKDQMDLSVVVKNTDTKTFPFTIGWHPYFYSQDLFNSNVGFKSNKTAVFDKRNITLGINYVDINGPFKIENKTLDDCFILDSNKISFETPAYHFVLKSSEKNYFLQLYTPPKPNTIAIEPTTGISNSLNNGIGLKTLSPNEIYNISWNLLIK